MTPSCASFTASSHSSTVCPRALSHLFWVVPSKWQHTGPSLWQLRTQRRSFWLGCIFSHRIELDSHLTKFRKVLNSLSVYPTEPNSVNGQPDTRPVNTIWGWAGRLLANSPPALVNLRQPKHILKDSNADCIMITPSPYRARLKKNGAFYILFILSIK